MTKKHLYILSFILLGIIASCSNDDEPSTSVPGNACYDFVTISRVNQQGTEFTLRKSDDTPLISYLTAYVLKPDTLFYEGKRLIIAYNRRDGEPYTSGAIQLYGYRLLDNTAQEIVQMTEDSSENWKSDKIDIKALTRTGNFINLTGMLYCTKAEKPEQLILTVDISTIDDPYPELHLIYKAKDPGDNSFTGYASFDIGSLWSKDTCKGVSISHVSPNGIETKTFNK